ncbi:MAG TPA: SDR family NAD(P)-dependent oxidoreductase [Caulobacteraceae bacterium]
MIVTGASRGIGLAIATRLAGAGYSVAAVARTEGPALTEAIAASERRIAFTPFDLTQLDAIPELVRGLRAVGPIWGLVNNAGLGTDGLLANMHPSQVEAMIRLNVTAPILLTKHVARGMMTDQAGGRIVNMSSIIASTGYSGLSVYGATKAAMVGFSKSLARELGRMNVTVNAIAPGFIDTEMTAGLGDEGRDQVMRRSALRRLAEVDDVAAMVELLMGDGGKNITGAVMTIDAGNTA